MNIVFTAPVRIESEMNRRDHWTRRRKRFKAQERAVYFAFAALHRTPDSLWTLPSVVTLTRIGPRTLDTDNLAGGFKQVRDTIADLLGYDDGDPRVEWIYAQEKGKPKEYAIRVEIRTNEATNP